MARHKETGGVPTCFELRKEEKKKSLVVSSSLLLGTKRQRGRGGGRFLKLFAPFKRATEEK